MCVCALWLFLGFVVLVIGLSDCCKISRLCFRQRELLGHKKSMWRPSTTTSCTQLINSITRLHINLIIYMFRFWIFVLNLDFFSFFEQTGNGFIRVVGEVGEGGYDMLLQEGTGGMAYTGFRSNPATNDWVPNIDEDQVLGVPCLESHRGREDL